MSDKDPKVEKHLIMLDKATNLMLTALSNIEQCLRNGNDFGVVNRSLLRSVIELYDQIADVADDIVADRAHMRSEKSRPRSSVKANKK